MLREAMGGPAEWMGKRMNTRDEHLPKSKSYLGGSVGHRNQKKPATLDNARQSGLTRNTHIRIEKEKNGSREGNHVLVPLGRTQ